MTRISLEMVRHIAHLAHLSLSAQEEARMALDMSKIVGHFEHIAELPLDEVEATVYTVDLRNVFAADTPQPGLPRHEALKNAPDHDGAFFRVPQVLDGG